MNCGESNFSQKTAEIANFRMSKKPNPQLVIETFSTSMLATRATNRGYSYCLLHLRPRSRRKAVTGVVDKVGCVYCLLTNDA
jgi:hypothetical protein